MDHYPETKGTLLPAIREVKPRDGTFLTRSLDEDSGDYDVRGRTVRGPAASKTDRTKDRRGHKDEDQNRPGTE